MMLHVAASLLW